MGDVVNLKPVPLVEDDELIADLARFADGTFTEAAVKSRHRLSDEDWAAMGERGQARRGLVEADKLRRIRSGANKTRTGAN